MWRGSSRGERPGAWREMRKEAGGGGGVTPHTCTCVENRKRRTVGSDVCTLSTKTIGSSSDGHNLLNKSIDLCLISYAWGFK